MLDPNYLLHISEGAEEISEALHNEIIKRIVKRVMLRISREDDYLLTAYDKWNIETLQQAGYLMEDIQQEIAKATKMQQTEIAEAMEEAGVKALNYDDKIYRDAGLSPKQLTQSPELIRLMQRNYEATLGEWTNFTRTTADQAQQLFLSEVDRAYNLVSTGALSYTQAVQEIINNIVSDGVKITYPTGREDTIETATLRAVRTGISQATSQIQMARAEEMGAEKAIISSHLGARPSHQVWQGKVFTLEELRSTEDGMPALGTVAGLCGANCRHSWSVWYDGMDNPFEQYDSEENRKQYEKEQRQRTLERRIRKTKREVMGLKESIDSCKDDELKFQLDLDYQKKSALLAKQNKAYNDYCEKNDLRPLSDRIQIARWDRQQAAAARGAAKRYENAHGGSVAKSVNEIVIPRNKNGEEIIFNIDGVPKEKQIEIKKSIASLSNKYDTCLVEVQYTGESSIGREAGKVDVTGSLMQLNRGSGTDIDTVYHEFAHTLDSSKRSQARYGGLLETNQEYWKEAKKLFNKYKKDAVNNRSFRISEYSLTDVDEFMAEAFATSFGFKPADTFGVGSDSPYVKEAREIIDKYFRKKKK